MEITGYCSLTDFKLTLAQTLTTASPNPTTLSVPGKLADIGKQLNLTPNLTGITNNPNSSTAPLGPSVATYSMDDIYFYLRQGQSIIDSSLSSLYKVPLKPSVLKTFSLAADIDLTYNENLILLSGYETLLPGHFIVLLNGTVEEIHEIATVNINEITTIDPIMNEFYAQNTRVLQVEFPNPIPFVCAKLACAAFYDKWARAQSEPMKTEYGDTLRNEALAELNNIREGRTMLMNVERTGQRFANPNLYGDAWFKLFQTQMKDDRR